MKYEKGSFIVVPNVKNLEGLHPTAQCLYMWLCFHANQNGECYPSRATLARETSIKKLHTLDKYLNLLIDSALLIKENRFREKEQISNNYYIPILGGVVPKTAQGSPQNGIGGSPQNGIQNSIHSLTQSIEEGAKAPKNLTYFRNQRRSEIGKDPLPKKLVNESTRVALRRLWIIDEFHRRASEIGLEYLDEEDNTANRKFFGLAKALNARYPERKMQVEYLDWWFTDDNGGWANYHPSNFFSVSEWLKFENPKQKKGGVGVV